MVKVSENTFHSQTMFKIVKVRFHFIIFQKFLTTLTMENLAKANVDQRPYMKVKIGATLSQDHHHGIIAVQV